jgi:hypothetical protein
LGQVGVVLIGWKIATGSRPPRLPIRKTGDHVG